MNSPIENLRYVNQNSSLPSRYELVAEEAIELAHVAQKLARFLRGEQPVSEEFNFNQEQDHFHEEFVDTVLAVDSIFSVLDSDRYDSFTRMYNSKLDRWAHRLVKNDKESQS